MNSINESHSQIVSDRGSNRSGREDGDRQTDEQTGKIGKEVKLTNTRLEEEKDKYLTITNTPLFLGVHKSQFGGSAKD